ncbi:MAG: SusC/RagA family TonB-linked outer membrane protein [Bacteroidia bacterium]|nr:SusC/RagA family TonB-linked outer membrane protein [Bacteroidia bacterium]
MKNKHYFCNYTHFLRKKFLLTSYILFMWGANPLPVFASPTPETGVVAEGEITLKVANMPIRDVLPLIEKQSKFIFVYNSSTVNLSKKVTLNLTSSSISEVMSTLLKGTAVSYEISDRQILLFTKKDDQKPAKSITSTGIVKDETGEPLIGVSVQVKGSTQGTITDIDGKYSLQTESGKTLVFSYVGYKRFESAAQSSMTISLNSDTEVLNEVVVIGYGTMKKSDLTGSVAGVKAENFNKGLVTSPSQLIQGRVSGVNITNNGGEPGGGATIRVRGSNSIRSGQDPLYVVDGVPLDISDDQQPSGANVSGVGSNATKNPLNFLNPDDIESIDILKDASATAIYGARGANGVIMVTTKKGVEGRTQVSYSAYGTVSSLPKQYEMLSADRYRSFAQEKGVTIDDGGVATNWQDEIFRTAYSHNHNFSMSGGFKNGNYRASFGIQDQEGIVNRTGMKKYTGRVYLNQKTLNNRLNIEASLTATRTNDQRVPIGESGGFEGDVLLSALKVNPTYPIYNADGTYFQKSKDVRNPVAMINLTDDKTQTDRILANVTGTLDIWKGLKYKMNVAFDEMKASRKVTQDKSLIYLSDKGTADINNVESSNFLIENYLTYNTKLGTKHRLDFLAGHSFQKFRNYRYGFSETGFEIDDIDYLYNLSFGKQGQITGFSNIQVNELQSFFGRVNYNLMDRYLFTMNFRVDGSTKFGTNNKYGFFPSAAFAWRMSEERFIKKMNFFDNLKLRLSWGVTGNQEIPNKISQVSLGSSSVASTGAILDGGNKVVSGITLLRTPNPNIKWERTEQVNLGVDFSIFRNRLSGSIDYFQKETRDVLLEVYSIAPAPTPTVWSNVPDMKILNRGWEIGLNGVLIDARDWRWSVGANFSKITNEVKKLPMTSLTTGQPSGPGIDGFTSQIVKSGYPIGTFWGYQFLGFDENGKSLYEMDENGKKVEKCIGNAQPDFSLNFNTNLSWKNFDLSLFFNSVVGNDVYNNLANVMDNLSLFSKGYNTTVHATTQPEALDNVLDYSSRYIESGSYLRLSSATLGYLVPLKSKKWLSNLKVTLTGNNLFVITGYSGYDPEVNANRTKNGVPSLGIGWTTYPMARSFSLGLSADF